jgi:hypothetical protein
MAFSVFTNRLSSQEIDLRNSSTYIPVQMPKEGNGVSLFSGGLEDIPVMV